jgi:sugar lactone lactonase YvrE
MTPSPPLLLSLAAWALAGCVALAVAGCGDPEGGGSGPRIETVAGDGGEGFSGDGSVATQARLQHPQDVAVDAAGNLYIADTDNHRVRKVDPGGVITTVAGDGTPGFGGDGSTATLAQLFQPQGVDVDDSGNLYIADTENNRIRRVDPTGRIETVAGTGEPGYGGDGGMAVAALLFHPTGVRADPHSDDLYVVDARNNRIRRIRGGVIETVAGDGQPGSSGDGGSALSAQLRLSGNYFRMGAVDVSADGTLWIADSGNHVIRRVDPRGRITRVAGTGTYGRGGNDGFPIDAGFAFPAGIAIDHRGDLLVSDTANQDLRRVRPEGSVWHVAGIGIPDSGGDGGPAREAGLRVPMGLAVQPGTRRIFLADVENNRVRRIGD